eukprot:GILI01028711.1.p1 GENE.GILI01028711.1~~GILI01028711.1.p1  ORF type:complete len:246 (+),score=32.35 GILI01028711.1:82-819(+)
MTTPGSNISVRVDDDTFDEIEVVKGSMRDEELTLLSSHSSSKFTHQQDTREDGKLKVQEDDGFDDQEFCPPPDVPSHPDRIGFVRIFRRDKLTGEPTILIGPHWFFSLGLMLLKLGIITYFFSFVHPLISDFLSVIGACIFTFQICVFSLLVTSNPGYVPKNFPPLKPQSQQELLSKRYCRHCNIVRPPRCNHCEDCNACVLEDDHHCPWVGKCVADKNLVLFYTFLASSTASLSFFLAVTLTNS